MKISVIITTILVAQVSASLFDVFHSAVLSVQNGFGKLLSDVVTDVKDTVDCTILAVEHVLSLSPDATTRYYNKCGTNKTDSVSDAPQNTSLPKVEVTFNLPNNEEFLEKMIPTEIDGKINEKLSKVLDNYQSNDNVLTIERVLANESEQLAGVRGIVKMELEKLSNDVTTDLKNIDKQRNLQPSVDTILQEIKVLEKRLLITKNTTEANEIHQEINQLLGKLDAMKATEATENGKLEEIIKELENNSNNSFVGLRHQFEQWKEEESRNLNKIKSKIEEHEKISELHNGSYHIYESNQTDSVLFIKDMKRDDVSPISSYLETSSNNTILIKDLPDNSTSSSSFGNGKTLISDGNDVLFSENKTFDHSGVNDTAKTNNSFFNTGRSIGNETIDTTTESDKQKPLASREPIVTVFSINENNSNETVINLSNPKQGLEIEGVKLHVKSKNDSIKKLLFDSAENNVTIIRSAVETEIIATSQNKNILNDTAISNKSKAVVKNISVNATNTVNIVSSTFPTKELVSTLKTFDDIKSNDAIIINTVPPIERIPISEEDLGNIPRLEATPFLRTPNIPDLNYSIRSPPLMVTTEITELKQQNYNTSGEPENDYDYKVSKSLSDSSLQTRQPLINPEAPNKMLIYSQPVETPIIRGKDQLQDADKFASFDTMDEQLLHPSSPIGNSIAITNKPLIPELMNPPRKSPRMNLESPSFVPPLYPIRPPLSSDDKASENTYRPPMLTTHIPRIPEPRANNYKISSMDYDSFFHMPRKNSEAHKRALKEALQLIANSKRTDRIINNIMKNKSKFNARSIFNG